MPLVGAKLPGFYPTTRAGSGGGGGGGQPTIDYQTTVTADFNQPAVGVPLNISVASSAGVNVPTATGLAYIANFGGVLGGVYQVAPVDAVTIEITNLGGSPYQQEPGLNAPVGSLVSAGSLVIFIKNFIEFVLLAEAGRLVSRPVTIPALTGNDINQPASLATVNVQVTDIAGWVVGDTAYIPAGGYYGVVGIINASGSLTLLNVPTPYQVAPGTLIPRSSLIYRPILASNVGNDTDWAGLDVRVGPFLASVLDFIKAQSADRVYPYTPMPTLVAADYVQPAVAGTVIVTVDDGFGYAIGDAIYVDTGGLYSVTLVSGNDVTLLNTGAPFNAAPAASVLTGSVVSRPYRADQIIDDSDLAPHGPFLTSGLNKLAEGNVNMIYVDSQRAAGDITLATGTYGLPYPTLQSASDNIPVATDAAGMSILNVVFCADADYDEGAALTYDVTGRRTLFVATGQLGLGKFEGSFGDPTVRCNLLLTGDIALVGDQETFFGWTTLANVVGSSGADFNPIGARISGQIIDSTVDSSGAAFAAREIHGQVFGDTGSLFAPAGTAYDDSGSTIADGSLSLELTDAFFYGAVNATKVELQATRVSFPLALVCNLYSFVRECSLLGAFNAVYGPAGAVNPNEAPYGFVNTNFGPAATITLGTGTTPIHKLVLDGSSMQSLLTNAVVVTGGTGTVLSTFAAAAVLDYGATLALLAAPFAIAGGAPNAAATATQATALTEKALARPARLLKFAWRTAAADATTRIDVVVNGVSVATLALTGASGAIDTEVPVVAGDLVALQYTAGTAPGNGTYQLSS